MSVKQREFDDATMGEIWVRVKRIFVKLWAMTTRRIRYAVAVVSFL